MKKMLLLIFLSSSLIAQIDAKHIFNLVQDIYKVENDHKNACLDFEQKSSNEKMALLKKQCDELFELNYRSIGVLNQGTGIEAMLESKASQKVKLLQKHLEEWKELCERQRKAGESLYNQAKAELAKLDSSVATQSHGVEQTERYSPVVYPTE